MLKVKRLEIDGKEYTETWSDENLMIERDGILYEVALVLSELGREYVETDKKIEEHPNDATEDDYRAALRDMGVDV